MMLLLALGLFLAGTALYIKGGVLESNPFIAIKYMERGLCCLLACFAAAVLAAFMGPP